MVFVTFLGRRNVIRNVIPMLPSYTVNNNGYNIRHFFKMNKSNDNEYNYDEEEIMNSVINDENNDLLYNNETSNNEMKKGIINYDSDKLRNGINEEIYSTETHRLFAIFSMFSTTPILFGIVLVPYIVQNYPGYDIYTKGILGLIYIAASSSFPLLTYKLRKNDAVKIWITPNKQSIVIEKSDFLHRYYKQEWLVKDIKILHTKGLDSQLWMQNKKNKQLCLCEAEKLDHPVWFQILRITNTQITTVKHQMLFSRGHGTRFPRWKSGLWS